MELSKTFKDKLTRIACKQFDSGMMMKKKRMETIKDIEDLYFNKVLELMDNRVNIPFPIMSGQIDTYLSKIDNPPTVNFRTSDMPNFSEKIVSAWRDDQSTMRAGWESKDRAEKKLCLMSGRGINKIYASSVQNEYKSHYDVVDYHSFVCEGRNGRLEKNLYCGEKDIFRTMAVIREKAVQKIYDRKQVILLDNAYASGDVQIDNETLNDKYNRLKSLNLNPEMNAYVGQQVASLVEWNMDFEGKRYYLLFDIKTKIWLKVDELKNVYGCNKWLWSSWAFNPEEFMFWSKGAGDDILPTAEAMRLILNEAIENQRRRNRPMRITGGSEFGDVNELMEFVPDNVIVANQGKKGEIVTIETPEVTSSINLVQYLDNYLGQKTGVSSDLQGTSDKDTKVGVYYGNLAQASDRIGLVNKEYSDNYAEKGYRYFWGLKEHLTKAKSIELLGKDGIHMDELTRKELDDVGDVDDVIVSGGSREEEINEITSQRQSKIIAEVSGNPALSQRVNPEWLIKTALKTAGFNDEDIQQALDVKSLGDTQLIKEADFAIREIMLGHNPKINRGATASFIQHIIDYDIDNIDFEKTNKQGQIIGIDKKNAEISQRLRDYAKAHIQIVMENNQRKARAINSDLMQASLSKELQEPASDEALNIPTPTQNETNIASARPFETSLGTQKGVNETSQRLSEAVTPE